MVTASNRGVGWRAPISDAAQNLAVYGGSELSHLRSGATTAGVLPVSTALGTI